MTRMKTEMKTPTTGVAYDPTHCGMSFDYLFNPLDVFASVINGHKPERIYITPITPFEAKFTLDEKTDENATHMYDCKDLEIIDLEVGL